MLVLGLGLALRTVNNGLDLGLIGQGLGLVRLGLGLALLVMALDLALAIGSLTLHVHASCSCSKRALLSILSTVLYSIQYFGTNNQSPHKPDFDPDVLPLSKLYELEQCALLFSA